MSEEEYLEVSEKEIPRPKSKPKGKPPKDPPKEAVQVKEAKHPHPPLKGIAEESENAVLASIEMDMLEKTAGSSAELDQLRVITAQRQDDMCEAEYAVEDLAFEIKEAEAQLKEYSTKVRGKILAWFIKLYTGMPVVTRLEKKLDVLLDDQEEAIKDFEKATDAWREAQISEELQSTINRTRKGGKL